jgi:arsenite-transporting ATPase
MKVIFLTGKGGVGKSTLSAAMAWQLSQQYRVLIVSLDPAHNLGDIFNMTLKDKKTRFTDSLYLKEIDLKKLTKEYLKKEIDVLSTSYKYLQVLNLDNYFSVLQYSPGIEEYALLTSIETTIRGEQEFDYIVFDTPPTGLTLRFLALPKITITWIERLITIRQQILKKRYTIHRIRGPLSDSETVLDYDEQSDRVLTRLHDLHQTYEELNKKLQGPDTAISVVFNPDRLSLKESARLIEGLKELQLPLRLLLDNKVTDENIKMAEEVEGCMKSMVHGIPLERVPLAKGIFDEKTSTLYHIEKDITRHLR